MAAALNAYTLADRGTWLSFRNRQELRLLLAGDPQFFNPYGVILVNPARHPHVKQAEGRRFIAWLTGKEGQEAIASYRIEGQPLFFPQPAAPQ
jgi:tungstate transport system substrate-binding protein